MHDSFNLSRFVEAQHPVFSRVMEELRAGRKTSHWMWFIFPQIKGLGRSEIASRFAISGDAEARAYLQHDLLGPRLEDCVKTVLQHAGKSAGQIFGSPDDLKFHSCLTLFGSVQPEHLILKKPSLSSFPGSLIATLYGCLGGQPEEPFKLSWLLG